MHPKQFLKLVGKHSSFQKALLRIAHLPVVKQSVIIAHESHYFTCQDQMQEIDFKTATFILEPLSRDTAPALALAAQSVCKEDIILVLPADHVIENAQSFCHLIQRAVPTAKKGYLVTFGITPNVPSTDYGYIQKGHPLDDVSFKVTRFIEKPSPGKAQSLLSSKSYFWNSGIFLMQAKRYLEELAKAAPLIFKASKKAYSSVERKLNYIRVNKKVFETCPNSSIDHAVMEHTQSAAMIPTTLSWKDMGCWSSLSEEKRGDHYTNASKGRIIMRECSGCFFSSKNQLPIIAVGIKDQVIVSTKHGLLIANKTHAQKVKDILNTFTS